MVRLISFVPTSAPEPGIQDSKLSSSANTLTQVLPLLHNRLGPNRILHPAPPLADLPAAPAPLHRHDRRFHPLRAMASRPSRHLDPAVGPLGVGQLELQSVGVWGGPGADGPDAADAGVAGAARDLPELAGGVCFWVGGGDFLVVDYGYGLSGVC